MRILLDTNVVLSGILWNGPAKRIITLWLENRLTLLVSLPILEYQMFLEGAVGGKARYLVSGDKDLLVLKEVRGIPIVSLSVFLGQIK